MKNKCQFLFVLLTIIFFSFPLTCFSARPNPKLWQPLENNSYYNIKIITKSPDIRLVWTYKTITDDDRKKRIEEVSKYNLEKSIAYQDYHHETILWNMDCKNRLIMMDEFIDFDKYGKVLDRYRYLNGEWNRIVPCSKGDRLYQNVCVIQKKPPKKKKLHRVRVAF